MYMYIYEGCYTVHVVLKWPENGHKFMHMINMIHYSSERVTVTKYVLMTLESIMYNYNMRYT